MTARRSIWILALAAALTALLAGACSKAIGPDNEEEDDGEDAEAFIPVQQQEATPEDFAAEAASEEAARAEDADAGYGFDE